MSNLEDLVSRHKWQEEEEDDDVKDNWDDEDEEPVKPPSKDETKKAVKPKLNKKAVNASNIGSSNNKPLTAQELREKKILEEKMQRESDLKLTRQMLGMEDKDIALDFALNTKEDFDLFYKNLVLKLRLYDQSPHYYPFLDQLFRDLCVPLDSEELKNLSAAINALFNEKVKISKNKPKKKGTKGYALKVERSNIDRDDYTNELDDIM